MKRMVVCAVLLGIPAMASAEVLRIDTTAPTLETSPRLWGIFFEEINHSGDGGLYAEMVRNRSFEDNRVPEECTEEGEFFVSPSGWKLKKGDQAIPKLAWGLVVDKAEASFELDTTTPLNNTSPTCARLEITSLQSGGRAGIANEGYWGMSVVEGGVYELSVYVRVDKGYTGSLLAALESSDGKTTYATAELPAPGADYNKVGVTLTSNTTDHAARLVLYATDNGTVYFDMVSLFPKETYRDHANGLRIDLAEMVAALKPAFIRFPGGCIVEGFTPESAWDWKESIGDVALRPGRQNLWGYRASDGFGYHEMLEFAEDIGAEPIVVVNCGMTCQGRNPIYQPLENLQPYLQDALDAIEYANGGTGTKWGSERARNGHPEPFNMKYITIGNENFGPEYEARYRVFAEAIRTVYPEIQLISNSRMPNAPVDFEEHHYYMTPAWFAGNAHMYDDYDRSLPKVFVSEYAANQACGKGNLEAAVGEAAFMIGMENNSDIIDMAAYAPLFNNEHNREWPVNLIVFDNHRAYGTPAYYVQKLFAENRPDTLLALEYSDYSETLAMDSGRIGVGTWNTRAEFKDIEVRHGDRQLYRWTPEKSLKDADTYEGRWKVANGAIVQEDLGTNRILQMGDTGWTDYTLRLKARKIEGNEGFLILVRAKDAGNWVWLNLGGWGNSQHGIESCYMNGRHGNYPRKPGSIETDRWYDIEITVEGERLIAWLDGELLFDEKIQMITQPGIMANAGRVNDTGEYIIKVTNFLEHPVEMQVTLAGSIAPLKGTVTLLTAPERIAENSLDAPNTVMPQVALFHTDTDTFAATFPACSLTVIRAGSE